MKLLDEFEVPEHIKQHSFAMNRISLFLAKELKKVGEDVNVGLVSAASLLHDIDKAKTLNDLQLHGNLAFEWLIKKGYPEVAEAVKKHLVEYLTKEENPSKEIKLLIYADQRCIGDKIVSLKEMHDYLNKRYPGYLNKEMVERIFGLEKDMFDKIGMKPEELKERVR